MSSSIDSLSEVDHMLHSEDSNSCESIGIWQWFLSPDWVTYDFHIIKHLEQGWKQGDQKTYLSYEPYAYEVDFHRMQKSEYPSRKTFQIRRVEEDIYVWAWEQEPGVNCRFFPIIESKLENLYGQLHSDSNGSAPKKVSWSHYEINLEEMYQQNKQSKFRRSISRHLLPRNRTSFNSLEILPSMGHNWSIVPNESKTNIATLFKFTKYKNESSNESESDELISEGTAVCDGNLKCIEAKQIFQNCTPMDPKPDEDCAICLDTLSKDVVELQKCNHFFHQECLLEYAEMTTRAGFFCPVCNTMQCPGCGPCPKGVMKWNVWKGAYIEGYPTTSTIEIRYLVYNGIQTTRHPYPSVPFTGTARVAYIPYNEEGKKILNLLIMAFELGHTFTVGTSVTTGETNSVVWNGIHHKTSLGGGATCYGYPDDTYFERILMELKMKGITPDSILDSNHCSKKA